MHDSCIFECAFLFFLNTDIPTSLEQSVRAQVGCARAAQAQRQPAAESPQQESLAAAFDVGSVVRERGWGAN